ncbi:hypothetical protein CRG98_037283 [Punica granatum]|uniref:Uncharacterized protein n=1 Tax=Punica granatum TaxID=22663 RepID=A0A2I0IEA5_PUNGR|nr:hypothetical protein CRG98_037283 [Punica granatum]
MGGGKFVIKKFDGSDYGFWRMHIEDYLYGKDLWQPLEDKPIGMTNAEWNMLDRRAMSVIRLSLSRNVAFYTAKEKTTKGILQVLADMYEKPSAANKLRGVRHIPGLKRNLISVRQLDDEGYDLSFGSSSWRIIKWAMVVARGKKEGTLYMTVNSHDSIALASANSDANLLHCRLGHMSEKRMKQLCSKDKLPGLKIVELELCEDCVFGKQKRASFSKAGRTLKEQKLELVHSDL